MALNEAETLVKAAQDKIQKIKEGGGEDDNIDAKLEKALKENKFL